MTRQIRHWKIPLLLVGLAYLLRTFSLDWQSFWLDEVHVVYFIDNPLMETVRLIISPEHNGPLYFLLLWGWRHLAGISDFALRYLSTLCSVLTVAVMWRIARAWFDDRVAGWTGLLFAISPFAIWFAQEAKMYALHMLLASFATLFLIKALRRNRWQGWLAYGITINLLGYSHFFGAFAIAAQGIVTVLATLRRPKKLRSYGITMILVALPYLPVVSFALRLLPRFEMRDISKGFVPLPNMLREIASEYVLRVSMIHVPYPARLLWPVALLILLGVFEAWRRGWRRGLWLTGLMTLPIAIFYPISLRVPVFSPKYLSATFPFFVMTLALALEALRRLWRPLVWGGLIGMVIVAGWANVRILTQPMYQRTNWRAAAAFLETHARADDCIVGFADYIHRPINRYYAGDAPVYRFRADAYQPEAYYESLERQGCRALWLVLHQDQAMAPHNRLEEAAGLRYPQITGVYPNNGQIAILGYSLDWRYAALPEYVTSLDAQFENGLALVGYHVDTTSLPPTDNLLHPPSNWLHVTTYWQMRGDMAEQGALDPTEFAPFIHLVDAQGGVWGGDLQRPPTVFHRDPPAQWGAETIVEAHYDVNLNPVTPPGTYRLVLGLVGADGAPIPTDAGAPHIELTSIEITQ